MIKLTEGGMPKTEKGQTQGLLGPTAKLWMQRRSVLSERNQVQKKSDSKKTCAKWEKSDAKGHSLRAFIQIKCPEYGAWHRGKKVV